MYEKVIIVLCLKMLIKGEKMNIEIESCNGNRLYLLDTDKLKDLEEVCDLGNYWNKRVKETNGVLGQEVCSLYSELILMRNLISEIVHRDVINLIDEDKEFGVFDG